MAKEKTTTKTKKKLKDKETVKPIKKVKQPRAEKDKVEKNLEENREKYYEAVGRRKTSIARVRLYTKKSSDKASTDQILVIVNEKPYTEYFPILYLRQMVEAPLEKLKSVGRFKATVKVSGGGKRGQAEAIRHGLARALVIFDQNFSKKMRKSGFLTRDPRAKERKKYGLKKARKAPQWSKR